MRVYLVVFGVAEGEREINESAPLAKEIAKAYDFPKDAGKLVYSTVDSDKVNGNISAKAGRIKKDAVIFVAKAK